MNGYIDSIIIRVSGTMTFGHTFERPGMLTLTGTQLTGRGKAILGSKLVEPIFRALNQI